MLNGTHVKERFIRGASTPAGIAVNGRYIYWANIGPNGEGATIGRAKLNGKEVNQSFITGASAPAGIALNASNVFWADACPLGGGCTLGVFGGTTIGRASLQGTEVSQQFIAGASSPVGVAVAA